MTKEEAIKKIKKSWDFIGNNEKEVLETLIPELKESEDERIRKEFCKDIWTYIPNEKAHRYIAWLEKQGSQKPIDKVEPKFKVGDWCIDDEDGTIFQIVKVLDNTYTYKTTEGSEYSCTYYSLENDARLWTIQDAKDGDVLAAKECNVLFKEIECLSIRCYCTYYYLGFFPSFCVNTLQNKDAFHPATKEQRNLLFQKMREAGYEWDEDKKELKRIEQVDGFDAELKETEGERIRTSIIAIINNYVDNSNTFKPKMLAWLEKQGEKKEINPTLQEKERMDDAFTKMMLKPQVDGFDAELNALLKKYEYLPNDEMVECLKFYTAELINNKQRMEQ